MAKLKLLSEDIKIIIVSSENIESFQTDGNFRPSTTEKTIDEAFEMLSIHVEKVLMLRSIPDGDLILNYCERHLINPFWAGEVLGANAFVKKPYTKETLLEAINYVQTNSDNYKIF